MQGRVLVPFGYARESVIFSTAFAVGAGLPANPAFIINRFATRNLMCRSGLLCPLGYAREPVTFQRNVRGQARSYKENPHSGCDPGYDPVPATAQAPDILSSRLLRVKLRKRRSMR